MEDTRSPKKSGLLVHLESLKSGAGRLASCAKKGHRSIVPRWLSLTCGGTDGHNKWKIGKNGSLEESQFHLSPSKKFSTSMEERMKSNIQSFPSLKKPELLTLISTTPSEFCHALERGIAPRALFFRDCPLLLPPQ